jgi:hypothetical protein
VWKRGKIFVAFVLAHEQHVVSKWRFVGTEENIVRPLAPDALPVQIAHKRPQ